MKRCMSYACNHAWSYIPETDDDAGGYDCIRCGDFWDWDDCDHEPEVKGCECAR